MRTATGWAPRSRSRRSKAHLRSLLAVLQIGRFSATPVWREYIDFVVSRIDPRIADWIVAVRHGRIERVDLPRQGTL